LCPENCNGANGVCHYSATTIYTATNEAFSYGVGECKCNFGFSSGPSNAQGNCSVVDDVTNIIEFSISSAPSRVCRYDNLTATIPVTKYPENGAAAAQFIVVAQLEGAYMNNQTSNYTVRFSKSSATTWALTLPQLPAGDYVLLVEALDPLGRGSAYAVTHTHRFSVSVTAVVLLSTNPDAVPYAFRPLEVQLRAIAGASACMSTLNPVIIYTWNLQRVATNGSMVSVPLPSSVAIDTAAFEIPEGTLNVASTYVSSVSAYYQEVGINSLTNANVQVSVGYSPLDARYKQGKAITANLPISLEVEAEDPDGTSDSFTYACTVSSIDGQDWTYAATTSTSSPLVTVGVGAISADAEYFFNCSVGKGPRDPVLISSRVTVSSVVTPSVTIVRELGKIKPTDALMLLETRRWVPPTSFGRLALL